MPRTNMNDLLAIPISIPTLYEQKEFARRIKKTRNIQNSQKLKNQKLEELQSSLLQRAFSGEL